MPILTIDARDWFRGISTTDELSDGGFSPSSKGINLFASPGLLLPGQAPVDASSAVTTGGIFAWSTWHTSVAPGIGRGVGSLASNSDGKFFTLDDGGAATLEASDTGRDYKSNETDIIRYQDAAGSNFYITSTTDVAFCDFDFTVNDFTWWSVTQGEALLGTDKPHHFVQYGAVLYWTDGRFLHSWDGTTSTTNALDLPLGYVITDITVHNNLIYMAASHFDPIGGGEAIVNRIFTWDGISASFIDEFLVQEKIDTLIVFGGTLFVTTQRYFGYFTGSTISPLYPLTSNVYKYQYAITHDRLYLLQTGDLLCYGNPIVSRPKFFSFPLHHASTLIGITSYRSGKIVYAYASASGSWSDVNASNQVDGFYQHTKIPFGRQVIVKAVILETQALASGSSQTIAYLNDAGTSVSVGTYSHTLLSTASKHQFDLFSQAATFTCQPKITFGATPNKGIRRIHIVYEPTEVTAKLK